MSEVSLKPLIFLPPLSPTLTKLKEVMSENAEAEGIEIIEAATIEEAVQLIPAMGQSLIMSASPKQCAVALQACRRFIKKIEAKTILLSPKAIPPKTLEKFMKIGLTECVVEPVNPKTLLYKVRLQLRSIKTKTESAELELKSTKGQEKAASEQKQNRKKGAQDSQQEENQEDLYARKKVQRQEEQDVDYNLGSNHKEDQEQAKETHINMGEELGGHMKGDVDGDTNISTNESLDNTINDNHLDGHMRGEDNDSSSHNDQEGQESGYREEAIAGHYKGHVQEEQEDQKEEQAKEATLEEEIAAAKEDINKAIQDEVATDELDKKDINDPTQKDPHAKSNYKEDDLGGHYEGQNTSEQFDGHQQGHQSEESTESASQNRSSQAAQEQDEQSDHNRPPSLSEDIGAPLMGEQHQELPEQPDENNRSNPSQDDLDDAKKNQTGFQEEERPLYGGQGAPADEIGGPQAGRIETDHIDDLPTGQTEGEEAIKQENPAGDIEAEQEIDGYLRGGAAKKAREEEADHKKRSEAISHEDEENQRPVLNLKDDDPEQDDSRGAEIEQEDHRDDKSSLDLEDDPTGKKSSQEEDQEQGKRKSNFQEDAIDNQWSEHHETEKKQDRHNKSDARSDHLSTHYSSKKSTAHNEESYGKDWKALREDEEPKKAKKREQQLQTKDDHGEEQTINYEKLKKEFEGIEYGSIQKEKLPYHMESESAEIATVSKTVLGSDGQLHSMSFEEIVVDNNEDEEGISLTFYEPNPQGTDHIIHILHQYLNPHVNSHAIYQNIALRTFQESQCYITFYRHLNNNMKLIFNGYCDHALNDLKDQIDLYNEKLSERIKQWQEIEQEHLMTWQQAQTPTWQDPTFQNDHNYFVFPYFEGKKLFGMAIAYPEEKITKVQVEHIEVLLESARGLYLESLQESSLKTSASTSEKNDKKNNKKGLWGNLFKKVVGK